MDAVRIALPVLGIVAAAALTFYAVSFAEIREKSFADLEDSEMETGGFNSSLSSRQRRARRQNDIKKIKSLIFLCTNFIKRTAAGRRR
ncbi:hypothetical protein QQ045_012248 [Rhodiola kirilowii]